jgi:pSer/pThr/pTyr-binding forkhead associated (FHA) protein
LAVSRRPGKYAKQRAARRAAAGGAGGAGAGAAQRTGFILTVVDGANLGKEYFFERQASIGRVETNDIVLVEPGISRNHARVFDDEGIFILEDSGSANGTRLNGEPITEPEVLRDGDYITLSQTTLQFSQLTAARGAITTQTSLSDLDAIAVDTTATKEDPALAGKRSLLRTRKGKLLLLLLLLLVSGVAYYFGFVRTTGQLIVRDVSDEPLTYSEEDDFFNAVFGNDGKYDTTHKYQVIVEFEYLGGRATLQYGAWGVDKVGEVLVLLNGEQVGQVPLTLKRWVYGLKLVLPRGKLKKGKTNQIIFKNTRATTTEETWAICYLQILQEAIPPPDPKEARHQFDLAKKSWEDRDIEPSNMYTALEHFKKARDLLEGLSQRPDLYQDALDYIDKVDKALTRKFSDGLFSARRAEKLDGDTSKARDVLLRTRRYFHKDDFRYREIQRYLDALAGY